MWNALKWEEKIPIQAQVFLRKQKSTINHNWQANLSRFKKF